MCGQGHLVLFGDVAESDEFHPHLNPYIHEAVDADISHNKDREHSSRSRFQQSAAHIETGGRRIKG